MSQNAINQNVISDLNDFWRLTHGSQVIREKVINRCLMI